MSSSLLSYTLMSKHDCKLNRILYKASFTILYLFCVIFMINNQTNDTWYNWSNISSNSNKNNNSDKNYNDYYGYAINPNSIEFTGSPNMSNREFYQNLSSFVNSMITSTHQ